MTTRSWKLEGQIVWPGSLDIAIDGTTVASNLTAESSEYTDRFGTHAFIATGTYDVDDAVDSAHTVSITVNEGTFLIGCLWWNNAYIPATLSDADNTFKFKHDVITDGDTTVPALDAAWGAKDPNEFSWYPGKNTIYSVDSPIKDLDPRANIILDGEAHSISTNFEYIDATVGSVLQYDFGIPGDVSGGAPN
jgi:hypothetical protein